MHWVLVDNGSSADILYYPTFQQIGIDKERLIPTNAPLVSFGGRRVFPLGVVRLSIAVGDYPQQITRDVTFLIVDCSFTYNAIISGNVLSFVQLSPLIDSDAIQEIGFESNWTTPLVSYLKNEVLPDGKEAARKLKV